MSLQGKYILQKTSDVNLIKKMKMFQGLQYKTEIFVILIQHFLIFRDLQKAPKLPVEGTSS